MSTLLHKQVKSFGQPRKTKITAIFSDVKCIGIGSVVRDEDGRFIRARRRRLEGLWTPREAEAISLKEAMIWTKARGLRRCIFETDAKLLADAYNGVTGNS